MLSSVLFSQFFSTLWFLFLNVFCSRFCVGQTNTPHMYCNCNWNALDSRFGKSSNPVSSHAGLAVKGARKTYTHTHSSTLAHEKLFHLHSMLVLGQQTAQGPDVRNLGAPRWWICPGPDWSWYITSCNLVLNHTARPSVSLPFSR